MKDIAKAIAQAEKKLEGLGIPRRAWSGCVLEVSTPQGTTIFHYNEGWETVRENHVRGAHHVLTLSAVARRHIPRVFDL